MQEAVAAGVEGCGDGDLGADEQEVEGAEEERAAAGAVLAEDRGADGDPEDPRMRAQRVGERALQDVALVSGA